MRPIPYDESVTGHGGAHAVRGAIVNDHLLQNDLGPQLKWKVAAEKHAIYSSITTDTQ